MIRDLSRRFVLASLASRALFGQKAGAGGKPSAKPQLPRTGEFVRFVDPLTENVVSRLTSIASASYLPASGARFMSSRERFLVFSSDRTGRLCPFVMDLRTGAPTQLAATAELHAGSLELAASGKSVYLLDGGRLMEISLTNKKANELATGVSAFSTGNSAREIAVIRKGRLERILEPGRIWAEGVSDFCLLRPGGEGCLVLRNDGQELWYVSFSELPGGKGAMMARGPFSDPCWSPDGSSVLILRGVELPGGYMTAEIHEVALPEIAKAALPETEATRVSAPAENVVTRTTRFAAFSPNGDGSVYVGASRSRAQPSVILLVRSVRREMMLCEHRASDPAKVRPSFSPDSRRVYFQSDFQGKPAIYAVNVEQLVEPTLS